MSCCSADGQVTDCVGDCILRPVSSSWGATQTTDFFPLC